MFDHSDIEFWRTSLLICIEPETGEIEYIPICKNGNGVRLSDENETKEILYEFKSRSEKIKDVEFVEKEYEKFAEELRNLYLTRIDSIGIFFKIINKLCKHKLRYKISKKRALAIRNYVECEAHRELFLKGISDKQ